MVEKFVEISFQFVLLIVAGGYVTKLYTKSQKDKDVRQNIVKEFSEIFSKFVALRFKANVHLLKDDGVFRYTLVSKNEISGVILECYNESCELLGRYQALKPLIHLNFKVDDVELDALHQFYQTWRRSLREINPVYQSDCPNNDAEYKQMRAVYHKMLGAMREQS